MWQYNYSDEYLAHYGVLGMKWGVRKDKTKGALRKRKSTPVHDDYKKAHSGKSVKSMSDSELRSVNNRLQMERQYSDLTRKTSKGKKVVNALIKTAGTIAAAEASYKTYNRIGKQAVDAIGDWVMADLAKGLSKGFN